MILRQRRFLAATILLTFALLGGGWLLRLDYERKISTDVLDLIPGGERAPELALVRELAGEAEARTMFFVLTGPGGAGVPAPVAARFAEELTRSRAFDSAVPLADPAARDAAARALFEARFSLLFPQWLEARRAAHLAGGGAPADFPAWLARDAAGALGRFLNTPAALGFQEVIPADPILLMPRAVDELRGGLGLYQPAAGETNGPTLVSARLAHSPLSERGQAPAFAAIAQATAAARAEHAGLEVNYTGVNRFAAASRARIQAEVSWLNLASLAAVLAVAWLFIRGVHRGLHLVPVVLLSVLGAWVAVTLAFDRVHILVFVVGSLLTGVAIDYGFYLYMQPPVRPGEDYGEKVRRLLKPLLASCLTTVVGFALLLFSELPLIRQLGVFVGAGLVCALGAALVYFSMLENCFLEARTFRGGQALAPATRRVLRRALLVAWVLALAGLARLQWRDDIRELEIPSPELKANDARIRSLFGERGDRTVYLTYGANVADARRSLDRLEAWLRTAGEGRATFGNLGPLVPSADAHARAVEFVRGQASFPAELKAALSAGGFDPAEFGGFFEAYQRHAATARDDDLERAVRGVHAALKGPPALLLHLGQPWTWFVTVVQHAPAAMPPRDANSISGSQLQTLNQLFARYRASALRLSAVGFVLVGVGVFLTYGLRSGVRIFAIPCGACLGVFGVLGWAGQPLNLFHLLGAFLGVCLTHNYSIFSATSAFRREATPVSVRLSALTTAASFGVLALSAIPVVRALGITVAAMVVAALLVIELEHLSPLGGRA